MFFRASLTDLIKNNDVVEALQRIDNNEEINSCTFWGQYTPLHLAIETNQPSIVDALLLANANVNAVTYHDQLTPLHIAASFGDLRSIRALVKYNSNLNAKTYRDQDTALHIVAKTGLIAHAEELLKAGAIVDSQNKNKDTAMHIAAKQGNKQLIELLLSYNSNCNMHNNNEQTPLFEAMLNGHYECAALLVKNGANFGNSFNSVKKLQASYDDKCKQNDTLYNENLVLRGQLAIAEKDINDLKLKLEKLERVQRDIPVAEVVGNALYGPRP